ncbi:MAG: tRNA pseudouridine(55) synthase TruB [Gomphosphaeria aponina SAG 52.96 = DSM 107014]|uniref:tRNA pseudouridine synthase B n=1 Tax=Gomphosphaeria aponina SAG 52.96 = DSM 107014 TaxID=1521640 RepID=A0A941GW11_9CHRO|nr:tRNA pseudouridine(55) synthase TruB [Gomphosphaeria aponina SAG 52.96 = DSM 107014]
MLGFLNLNKPVDFTSHDCVAKVRKILQCKRVGHGGTLDPAATGVLPIAVGQATRLLQFLPEAKAYRAKIRFGVQTTTDDLAGEVIERKPCSELTLDQVEPLLGQFLGKIEQIPPAYSAIQRGGKRLYELARAGEKVDVPVRTVEVSQIEVLGWNGGEYPELEVAIACGPGTYIRAIARDLGNLVGVGGTLAGLIRTLSCGMNLENSVSFEDLEIGKIDLIKPDFPLQNLTAIKLNAEAANRWCQGQKILIEQETITDKISVRVYQEQQFLGVGELINNINLLCPKVVLI